jgi:hypothetical protein
MPLHVASRGLMHDWMHRIRGEIDVLHSFSDGSAPLRIPVVMHLQLCVASRAIALGINFLNVALHATADVYFETSKDASFHSTDGKYC